MADTEPSPLCAWIRYEHLDRETMTDHVAAVVPVMLAGLDVSHGVLGTGQQRVSSRSFRRVPIELPAPPRMPLQGVQEIRRGPGSATVRAHGDLCYVRL